MNIKPYYLQFTSSLLLIPYFYYILKEEKNIFEIILCLLLLAVVFFSQLFWNYPIKKSTIHIIDKYVAIITVICFVIYTLCFKKNMKKYIIFYIFLLLITLFTFYKSYYYSSKIWCSFEHLYFHGISHILCVFTSFYTLV